MKTALLGICLTAVALPLAAEYRIDWFTMDGGGGRSSGGNYSLVGTIGQPDAGSMAGGNFSLVGGFWSLPMGGLESVIPGLRIHVAGSDVVLSWENPSTGYKLQSSPTLSPTAWVDVPGVPVVNGSDKQVNYLLQPGHRFFRLFKP